jgi:hypothetical protein
MTALANEGYENSADVFIQNCESSKTPPCHLCSSTIHRELILKASGTLARMLCKENDTNRLATTINKARLSVHRTRVPKVYRKR